MNETVKSRNIRFNVNADWWKSLNEKISANAQATQHMIDTASPPMNYYNAFHEVRMPHFLKEETIKTFCTIEFVILDSPAASDRLHLRERRIEHDGHRSHNVSQHTSSPQVAT